MVQRVLGLLDFNAQTQTWFALMILGTRVIREQVVGIVLVFVFIWTVALWLRVGVLGRD